ncbi:MAG: hypothetical protein Q8M94_21070, partial [Ignavibacteria bacterium]|nr:hypothetical protein [Ignavibacteria bacterium]
TAEAQSLNYPNLKVDDSATPVARIRTYYPNPAAADKLYTLGVTNNPVIGFKGKDSRLIYIGLPLNRVNASPFNVKRFFQKVFIEEFGLTP